MNKIISVCLVSTLLILFFSCSSPEKPVSNADAYKIIFLHHSTGNVIWKGKPQGWDVVSNIFSKVYSVPSWFEQHNLQNGKNYFIEERVFPKKSPYGWNNYPYDYYNIWVKNAGLNPYQEEPTLEMLTPDYNMIIFKHCFPVSLIEPDIGEADLNSEKKRIENYKAQYIALKGKMMEFPETKFLIWTPAALVEGKTNPEQAGYAREFVDWVRNDWDENGDNIFLWDLYELETEGTLYLKPENARGQWDSHPDRKFAGEIAPLFCQRIVDVVERNGNNTYLTGKKRK